MFSDWLPVHNDAGLPFALQEAIERLKETFMTSSYSFWFPDMYIHAYISSKKLRNLTKKSEVEG